MLSGAIRFWQDNAGSGFIIPEFLGEDAFVHRHVQYSLAWHNRSSKYQAANVWRMIQTQSPALPLLDYPRQATVAKPLETSPQTGS